MFPANGLIAANNSSMLQLIFDSQREKRIRLLLGQPKGAPLPKTGGTNTIAKMSTALLCRRPLGCLKVSMRQTRQQKLFFCRAMATATGTENKPGSGVLPDHNFCMLLVRLWRRSR